MGHFDLAGPVLITYFSSKILLPWNDYIVSIFRSTRWYTCARHLGGSSFTHGYL